MQLYKQRNATSPLVLLAVTTHSLSRPAKFGITILLLLFVKYGPLQLSLTSPLVLVATTLQDNKPKALFGFASHRVGVMTAKVVKVKTSVLSFM